ncbi:hypothetical protein AR158_c115R [Paramecium bursaria Chlorella virus AR158]|uniref:hypothetical protein n=1 Tax=Paramecium bursaria Chlorella virus AR158 TaxID=380598 RepID=UPI00015AA7B9|nr:hypothetical protein AR158_c115R [Paramecium bursaria Chlorella virus AR158]ABU43661.1 hypothetical protein AR158_c115R [Paramecium bursaria Chlorella virus AR158]
MCQLNRPSRTIVHIFQSQVFWRFICDETTPQITNNTITFLFVSDKVADFDIVDMIASHISSQEIIRIKLFFRQNLFVFINSDTSCVHIFFIDSLECVFEFF